MCDLRVGCADRMIRGFLTKAWRVCISTCRECHCFLASASSAQASLRAALLRLTCTHAASSCAERRGSEEDNKTKTHTGCTHPVESNRVSHQMSSASICLGKQTAVPSSTHTAEQTNLTPPPPPPPPPGSLRQLLQVQG